MRSTVTDWLAAAFLWMAPAVAPAIAQLEIEGLPAVIQPVKPSFPLTDRYSIDATHGTVLDTVTGLVWLRLATCDELPGVGGLGDASWSEAMKQVALLEDGLCGLADGSRPGDWRLPTMGEWATTIAWAVALGCTGNPGDSGPPSLTDASGLGCHASGDPFQIVQFLYWTSTSDDVDPSRAWLVNLVTGTVETEPKVSARPLWAVRGGR